MPGLIRGVARTAAIAGTATAVSNRVSRRQAGRWADQEQQQYQQAPPPQYQEAPPQYQQPVYQEPPPPPVAVAPVAVVQPAAPPPAPEEDMSAKLAQLQQLGELKAQGILTDVEFEIQKQRILSS